MKRQTNMLSQRGRTKADKALGVLEKAGKLCPAASPYLPQGQSTHSLKAIGDRMSRFQQGSLFKLERKNRPDVWVFRWYESTSGKRRYKKQIIGTVLELRNRGEAEKAIIALRSSINVETGPPKSVCDLAAHYRAKKRFQRSKVIESCSDAISNLGGDIFSALKEK
jgi:hypothetical protein